MHKKHGIVNSSIILLLPLFGLLKIFVPLDKNSSALMTTSRSEVVTENLYLLIVWAAKAGDMKNIPYIIVKTILDKDIKMAL